MVEDWEHDAYLLTRKHSSFTTTSQKERRNMLDVTSVGANLSPEQQEATLADLTFFLDNYGSTRTVRFKIKAQQREIQRLMDRVQQFLDGREGEEFRDDKRQVATNGELFEDDMGGVDETMVDVDFFLRVYGSTQAVRQELSSQRKKIEILSKTVANFEKQQEQQNVNVSETQGRKDASGNSGHGEENGVQVESAGVVKQESKEHANDSSRSDDCRRLSHVTCRALGCMKWVKRNGDTSEYCTVHRGVTTASRGGYHICKVDGCDRRVIARKLCRNHGGCPRCKMSGCEKITSSIGKGYCYRHAREQGILGKQSDRSRVEKTSFKVEARWRPE